MSERTSRDSDPAERATRDTGPPRPSNGPGAVAAVQDMRRRLARVQHERRQAIYEARDAQGDRPTPVIPRPARLPDFTHVPARRVPTLDGLGPARDKLPTLDDLTSDDEKLARPARWRLVLALVAAMGGLGELARQLVGLFTHGK